MNTSEITLEFNVIKEMLKERTMSVEAGKQLEQLRPFLSERECRLKLKETTEAREILESVGNPPLSAMKEIESVVSLCRAGAMLTAAQLEAAATFIASCRRVKSYLKRAESLQLDLAYYGRSICEMAELQAEIEEAVSGGRVQSSASHQLRGIRQSIEKENGQIRKKLTELLQSRKQMFSDGSVTMRGGRYVLPVKKEYKNQFAGTVIDVSGSGATYFMEPKSISAIHEKLNLLQMEEENEVRRILYTLTALVDGSLAEIGLNVEAMVTLDVIFAKAKLSLDMGAVPAPADTLRRIEIKGGRHPLLRREECVPLDFSIGGDCRGVVITGPNTGGKTVALKTVGLLSMMAQSGLHVPVSEGRFCMNNLILCDIGDGQSIAENLSTFSSHITSIIGILRQAGEESLVLLDELGSGTDPTEGMGIAVSILEELRAKNCLFVATTHYPEVKDYAAKTEGLVNARMAFDKDSLKPLYRLEIGEAGESCALFIAQRLGFPEHMLARARAAAYKDKGWDGEVQPAFAPSVMQPRIRREEPKKQPAADIIEAFAVGDCVTVYPEKSVGIVYQPADEMGQVCVQVKGEKLMVSHKRLKRKVAAAQLYPEGYDFSIVFDSAQTRKIRHQMERKYTKGLVLEEDTEKPGPGKGNWKGKQK